ncbi:divalent heavy-metal cations transporter [Halogeometricum borinquense DSM 11551]|uniref:Divalent heavy-metal cations transporter n=2 Tax=Halogeometricum borinquense TaxID=60847 RepID=E4NTR9_HALBP|nr:ZIP family metal transporter [Halogeometricum borinquense]ADQ68224.1 predicted divalent heavy-metal cations transporter [Halogeometricum borinquense DSM 11551]ELY24732.1 divalent heavy-metal cations transporter [Halogeometricum borinquense DSM 11551]RYJ12881.1 ZIP family metal transporter [Halogeometricum borinquense]
MPSIAELFIDIVGPNPVLQGLAGGIVIAFMNLLGAVLVLIWRNPTERSLDGALGFAAGVMLSASFTSLLLPGIDFASDPAYRPFTPGGIELAGITPVLIGFGLGVILLDQGERWVQYVGPLISGELTDRAESDGGEGTDDWQRSSDSVSDGGIKRAGAMVEQADSRVVGVLLFTVAITLHNMPEGLAVGVGFGSGDVTNAIGLMLAIGIQNIPEGLAVSVAAINAGLGRTYYAAVAGIRAGIVEIPLAVFGAWAVVAAAPLLPYAMGFAAGGMLYVLGDEIIPETHAHGHERLATLTMMGGAIVMLTLDVLLG